MSERSEVIDISAHASTPITRVPEERARERKYAVQERVGQCTLCKTKGAKGTKEIRKRIFQHYNPPRRGQSRKELG